VILDEDLCEREGKAMTMGAGKWQKTGQALLINW